MKLKVLPTALAAFACAGVGAQAQGLLSIGSDDDFYSGLPFTTSIGVDFGWDSNPGSSSGDEDSSAYTRAGIDVAYGSGNRVTPIKIGASFGGIYYFDGVEGVDDDVFYNAKVTLNLRHSVNRRLTIGNNAYFTYEIEPDLAVGASNQRRLDQYFYGYNSLWASYKLSRRLNSVTRYTISGIRYDESEIGEFEDRFTHTVSEELRYLYTRRTTLIGEYRFTFTDYEAADRDYIAHYFLVGADHDFSRTLRGHLRVGGEFRDYDAIGNESAPYVEAALRQRISDRTSIHWVNRVGLEDSELGSFESRYTYRSSLNVSHAATARLRANGGITYLHNEFEDSAIADDISENLISLSAGLSYQVLSNVNLNANYFYTHVSSDSDFREYDRHRVSLGLSTTF